MEVRHVEIDYERGLLTADVDVGEEYGREFEFALPARPDLALPAEELSRRVSEAVDARVRAWLEVPATATGAPAGEAPPAAS